MTEFITWERKARLGMMVLAQIVLALGIIFFLTMIFLAILGKL